MKLRPPPGPVGGLRLAGPRGGDLGCAWRTGERFFGVNLSGSRSLYASVCGGDRACGERALPSRLKAGAFPRRLG